MAKKQPLTLKETVTALGVSRLTVLRWVKAGKLTVTKHEGDKRFWFDPAQVRQLSKQMSALEDWLTIGEAAEMLKLGKRHVYRLAAQGKLPRHYRPAGRGLGGRRMGFKRADVEKLIKVE